MNSSRFLLLPVVLLAFATPLQAQRSNLSAREAAGLVSSQFGPQSVQWIAEMRAQGGIPQPSDWQVLAYDQRSPRLLYRFWAGGGRAGDGGADDQRYPDDVPLGYFSAQQIGVDSVAAFTIAEAEARRARVAFDSCDYLLRLREYSTEPVWRLELLDASRRLVGKIYLSAGNGEVLRTVWVYRDNRARPDGLPLIVDSMAPGGQGAPLDFSNAVPPSPPLGGIVAPPVSPPVAPPVPGQAPGSQMGIHTVPLPPTPGVAVAGSSPYTPVDALGRPIAPQPTAPQPAAAPDDGIPAPPPIMKAPPAPVAPALAPAPPVPVTPAAPAAPSTAKPALKPSAGDSERIPPPPIPR